MQMSAMKTCFQIAECSLSFAKIRKNNEECLILHVFNYTERLILHISRYPERLILHISGYPERLILQVSAFSTFISCTKKFFRGKVSKYHYLVQIAF